MSSLRSPFALEGILRAGFLVGTLTSSVDNRRSSSFGLIFGFDGTGGGGGGVVDLLDVSGRAPYVRCFSTKSTNSGSR
jgi:hypothetical protein